jgi:uncharacterized repeat protein (TIGR03803 family)
MKYLTVLAATVMGLALGAATLHSQTFNNLYSFSALQGTSPKTNFDGQAPYGNLVLSGGVLYGTTYSGGTNGSGSVFSINTNGAGFTVLHAFAPMTNGTNADGGHPSAGLVLSGNMLYGTTYQGSTLGWGTVFTVSTNGTNFSVLHAFTNGLDGALPRSGLLMLSNTLYGTTQGTTTNSYGTIYSIQTNGSLAHLHSFSTNNEGALTRSGLTLVGGVLYGTTYQFGSNGFGSVYSINTDSTGFTILHNFTFASEGGSSDAPLIASGNTLFGTTSAGGTNGWGTIFSLSGNNFNVLHTFAGDVEGGKSLGGLALLGNILYGTAQQGGSANNVGTVYSIRTNGAGFLVLYTFQGGADGSMPSGGLVLSGKTAFGTTAFGGANTNNGGTVYSVTVPVLTITNLAISGSNILFSAVDGLSNGTYSLMTSSNAGSPFSQWKSVATTVLSSNGPFTITATNAFSRTNPAAFYLLQMQ